MDLFGTMVGENEQRTGDTPYGRAAKAQRLRDMGASEEDIADEFRVSLQTVTNWRNALDAGPEALAAWKSGLATSAVLEIAKAPPEERAVAVEAIMRPGSAVKTALEAGEEPWTPGEPAEPTVPAKPLKGRAATNAAKAIAKGKKPEPAKDRRYSARFVEKLIEECDKEASCNQFAAILRFVSGDDSALGESKAPKGLGDFKAAALRAGWEK